MEMVLPASRVFGGEVRNSELRGRRLEAPLSFCWA
jgi:hypothetical protein